MKIIDHLLEDGEYYKEVVPKDILVIHHTAGGHRPDWTIHGWEHDKAKNGGKLTVATAYVIGGISTTDGNKAYDGAIYRAYDDKYWAHHLGLKTANNVELNKRSIGIEICNYGPLTKTKDGVFLNYVNKAVPADMVGELTTPFRGFKYYHKYTDKQLASLKELIVDIARRHPKINIKSGLKNTSFELNDQALKGIGGLWSHSSYRSDKFDCWPQPQLIELIKSL
jgi:hypothetical protein